MYDYACGRLEIRVHGKWTGWSKFAAYGVLSGVWCVCSILKLRKGSWDDILGGILKLIGPGYLGVGRYHFFPRTFIMNYEH